MFWVFKRSRRDGSFEYPKYLLRLSKKNNNFQIRKLTPLAGSLDISIFESAHAIFGTYRACAKASYKWPCWRIQQGCRSKVHLHPYFVYASSESSNQTVHMWHFMGVYTVCLDKKTIFREKYIILCNPLGKEIFQRKSILGKEIFLGKGHL